MNTRQKRTSSKPSLSSLLATIVRRARRGAIPRIAYIRTMACLLGLLWPICLTAGEEGPYFSLVDLQKRQLPKREQLISALIPTTSTSPRAATSHPSYPARLQAIPVAPREYPPETIAYLAEHEIHHGDRRKPAVALTFDCEAGTQSTRQILETLRQENVEATFFILGKYAYMYPDIVREIAADGHELGNHSFYHPLFTAITPITATQTTMFAEITYTEAAIDWAVGRHVPMRYIRFPYGGRNDAIRRYAASLGYQSAFWDLDPRGWEPGQTPQDVVDYMDHAAHSGGIVIMHCGCWNDANALPGVIQAIRARGLYPGPLSSVLSEHVRGEHVRRK